MQQLQQLQAYLPQLGSSLAGIHAQLNTLIQQGKIEMSALTDLQDSLAALATTVSSTTSEIETLLGKITAPGTSDADIEAAVAQIKSLTQTLNDEVTKAQG